MGSATGSIRARSAFRWVGGSESSSKLEGLFAMGAILHQFARDSRPTMARRIASLTREDRGAIHGTTIFFLSLELCPIPHISQMDVDALDAACRGNGNEMRNAVPLRPGLVLLRVRICP